MNNDTDTDIIVMYSSGCKIINSAVSSAFQAP